MSLSEKALLVSVKVSTPGTARRDNDITEDTLAKYAASEGSGAFIKRILNSESMRSLKSEAAALSKYVRDAGFPWGGGFTLVPVIKDGKPFWPEFETEVTERISKILVAGEKVCEEYSQMVEEDKGRLGGTWKAADYPPLQKIQKSIKTGFQVTPVPDGDFRAALSEMDKEKLREKTKFDEAERVREAIGPVAVEMAEALAELAEVMADDEKKLHPNSVARIKRLSTSTASKLEAVFGDEYEGAKKLRNTLEKAAELADKIEPDSLNVNPVIREHYTNEADKLATDMAEFI